MSFFLCPFFSAQSITSHNSEIIFRVNGIRPEFKLESQYIYSLYYTRFDYSYRANIVTEIIHNSLKLDILIKNLYTRIITILILIQKKIEQFALLYFINKIRVDSI